jgi:hypothetical protein
VAGYSGTPLAKKLGIKVDGRVFVAHAPKNYRTLLAPLPNGAKMLARIAADTDIAHLFLTRRDDLARELKAVLGKIPEDCAIWVSWPKKSSKVPTDITEDTIRELALPLGLVDIKVCAVDEIWSGLKLVVRKENRGK